VDIKPFYDRIELISGCVNTMYKALVEGGLLIVVLLIVLLEA